MQENKPFDSQLIALEIHDVSLWEPDRVLPIIDKMERWGYNALVLHQNDLLDVCTQLFLSANYGVTDLRLKKVRNNVAWLNRLVKRLEKFDARLFLEIKEPSYHDYVLEQYPQLLGSEGMPNPIDPSWPEFCRRKVEDLLERVPGIGGIIVNLSSPESRVSMPDYALIRDEPTNLADWFDQMISAFHEPLEAAGKMLYVRDFSYTADLQSEVLAAVDRKAGKVGASIKITAHDYFPGYPENPAAALVESKFIFEFEAFGEHTGWGVIPNCRVAEICSRMEGYRKRNAGGMLVRVSWEAISGVSALDSLSAVNVYALPRLVNADVDAQELVMDWLRESFDISDAVAQKASDLMLRSWDIPATAYWNNQVFPRHSCLPSSWQEGWLSMETNGMGRREHSPEIEADDPRLTDAAGVKLFREKEAASELAVELAAKAEKLAVELPDELTDHFQAFALLPLFSKQFELATKATFYAARQNPTEVSELENLVAQLLSLADDVDNELSSGSDSHHHIGLLISASQIRLFARSLQGNQS